MRTETWSASLLVIGVVALAILGCEVADLIASFGNNPPNTPLTETVPLYSTGTPVLLSGERITADSANRVALLARLGNGVLSEKIAMSPDGRTLAFPSSYGIYLLDANTLEQVRLIEEPNRFFNLPDSRAGTVSQAVRTQDLAFSPDGNWLASGSTDTAVRLRRVSDGSVVREWKGESWVGRFVFSPDSALLATQNKDTVSLWRVSDGTSARELKLADEGDSVTRVEFSPDWSLVASQSAHYPPWGAPAAKPTRLWRVSDASLLYELKQVGVSDGIAFSPDGRLFASAASYGRKADMTPDNRTAVRLWRMSDGQLEREMQVPYGVTGIAFSRDGNLLELSDGKTQILLRVSDGTIVGESNTKSINADLIQQGWFPMDDVWFGPDESLFVAERIWRLRDGKLALISELKGVGNPTSVAFSPDGTLMATGTFDLEIALGRFDYILRFWRTSDGTLVREEKGLTGDPNSIAFSPDGRLLAVEINQTTVRLSRASDGVLVRELFGTEGADRITFSPDASLLATTKAYAKTVKLWRVNDGLLVREFQGESGGMVAFSPDSSLLALSDKDIVRLWRVSDGKLMHELKGTTGGVIRFSPDGKLLASSGSLLPGFIGDDTIRLWRVSDGSVASELRGATGTATFSPDGSLLVAQASRELGVIQLWRVDDGSLVREFKGHRGYVNNIVFSQDGDLLMSTYRGMSSSQLGDGTLGVWGIPGTR